MSRYTAIRAILSPIFGRRSRDAEIVFVFENDGDLTYDRVRAFMVANGDKFVWRKPEDITLAVIGNWRSHRRFMRWAKGRNLTGWMGPLRLAPQVDGAQG